MAGDAIGVAVTLRARHVGAHIGAALLLGHAHAERHAALCRPRREGRIVGARANDRHRLCQQLGLRRERRHRCARHGDGAQMSGLDPCCHVELRRAHDLGSAAGRPAVGGPCRIVHPGMGAARHQFVIGRMKLDFVAPVAPGIERPQFWRVLVGEPSPLGHGGRTPVLAELGQFSMRGGPAIGGDRVRKRAVQREQIDIRKWRRLVEHLMGRE